MSKGWDSITLKKLKALTAKGLSTSEIGKRLGISKNAVVGKLNRLGWNPKAGGVDAAPVSKPTPKKAKASVKVAIIVKKKAAPAKMPVTAKTVTGKTKATVKINSVKHVPVAKASKISTNNLAMHQRIIRHSLGMSGLRQDQCRWPMGDPDSENFHFCGDAVFVGKPYCYDHCKQAYQFTPQKKK